MASRLTDGAFGVYAEGTEDEVTSPAGAEDNPVAAVAGENTLSYMVVGGNAEMGFKELAYYMTFTPNSTGDYTFTHSSDDIGVADVVSDSGWAYGDWNNDYTVYTVSLVANTQYTILVSSFDWTIDLTDYEVGGVYNFASPYTITIAYASSTPGTAQDNALAYNIGDTILVSNSSPTVWYSFTLNEETNIYLIAFGGTVNVYRGGRTTSFVFSKTNSIEDRSLVSGTYYVSVTPDEDSDATAQILLKDEQSSGSCVATAIELTGNTQVGGTLVESEEEGAEDTYRGNWYKYTATADGTLTLSVTEATEGVSVSASVDVYVGFVYSESLYASTYVEDGEEEAADSDTLTLTSGVTYYFYVAPYTDGNGNLSVATLTFGTSV